MTKRGIIDLGQGIFRISKPGVDVDSAGPLDFLMHESHLYSQPYFFQYVPCPFAGYVGTEPRDVPVDVAVPNVTADPVILTYVVGSDGQNVYPHPRSSGPTSPGGIGNFDNWYIEAWATSATNVRVRFNKVSGGTRSPNGAYLILMRKPS